MRVRGFGRGYSNAVSRCDRVIRHMKSKANDPNALLDAQLKAYCSAVRCCKYYRYQNIQNIFWM